MSEFKPIRELRIGYGDAENYRKRENKRLFNDIFVKNKYVDDLLSPDRYFLIGEKGTGKTAYSTYLSNNEYKNARGYTKFIRETDYVKFISLKKDKHLNLSDFPSIWKVIIFLLIFESIEDKYFDYSILKKYYKLKSIKDAIQRYHHGAFSPEIINALNFIERSKTAAELVSLAGKVEAEITNSQSFTESRFQVNLKYIQQNFEKAFSETKLKSDIIMFIDGIDIRPHGIEYEDYLQCIKGLANAVWELNNDYFSQIRDTRGRVKIVLLVRPDIFISLGLQNTTNKIRDNSVFLDWRTTYHDYRESLLFEISDRILGHQQKHQKNLGASWDHYLPWKTKSTNEKREYDHSFINFLRISYSRPRDIITLLSILQDHSTQQKPKNHFDISTFNSDRLRNDYSEYLLGAIKDQLSFYYSEDDYQIFIKFFSFLNGKCEFSYSEYQEAFLSFHRLYASESKHPEFLQNERALLQFLYDTNIICYIELAEKEQFFRYCYRERSISNISPKVQFNSIYRIHSGLHKALNVGGQRVF